MHFLGTSKTGGDGIGKSFSAYFGLDQVAVYHNSSQGCGFVTDAGSGDISAFKTSQHDSVKVGSFARPVRLPWHRYIDPLGSGRGAGIGLAVSREYLFASYSDTYNIGVWEIGMGCTLELRGTYDAAGPIAGMRATPDGKTLVVGYGVITDWVDSFSIGTDGKLTERGPYRSAAEATGVDITKDSKYAIFGDATASTTQVEIYPINVDGSLGDGTSFGGDGSLGDGINSNNVWLSPDESFLFVSNNFSQQVTSLEFNGARLASPTSASRR